MAEPSPQEIQDKALGNLYAVFPDGLTVMELAERARIPSEDLRPELVQLLATREIEFLGANLTQLNTLELSEVLKTYSGALKLAIAADARQRFTRRRTSTKKKDAAPTTVKRTTPDFDMAAKCLEDAGFNLLRAGELTASDVLGSLQGSELAIESSAKAILAAAGFVVPKDHDVSGSLVAALNVIEGDEAPLTTARTALARLAWLNQASASLSGISRYGIGPVPANRFFDVSDARTWHGLAAPIVGSVRTLLPYMQSGVLRFTVKDGAKTFRRVRELLGSR